MGRHLSPRYGQVILVSGYPVVKDKLSHLDELTHEPAIWSWDTGQWLSCFDSCQLTISWMSYIKDLDLPRHPSLPFDSLPYPTRTICRRVRTLGQSRDNQTKRGWPYSISMGSVPRALRARGSPAIIKEEILLNLLKGSRRMRWLLSIIYFT